MTKVLTVIGGLLMIAIAGCIFVLVGVGMGRLAPPEPPKLEGTWAGKIKVPGGELTLVVHVTKKGDGYESTCDSPDQNAFGIPIAKTTLTGDAVLLDVQATKGVFDGKLGADGKKIVGTWKQAGMTFPLTLERTNKAPQPPKRPQTPKKPYPYREEDVKFDNKAQGVTLAGTLTLPQTGGPFPAVVLITGSGAQDRDESLLGHKPFLVIADYLTRRGIAVLRLDDRGVGGSTGNLAKATEQDLASDALCAVAVLRAHKEIDPSRVGLLGHSEGGEIAPLAASQSNDVAFVVMLAGPGVDGETLLLRQAADIARVSGGTDKAIADNAKLQKAIFKALREEKDDAKAEKRIRELFKKAIEATPADQRAAAELAPQAVEGQVRMCVNPWFRYALDYDPRPALRKVKCPVLAVNGEKDLQVAATQNLPEIAKALKAGGNRDVTTKTLPGLNHLLQKCTTGSPAEYQGIEETINPAALKAIGDWLGAHARR